MNTHQQTGEHLPTGEFPGDASSDESIVVELIPNIQRFQKKTASTLPPVESLQSRERDESSAEAHKTNITIAQTNNNGTMQVAKVSKLLMMMGSGQITRNSVNSLDDIDVDDECIENKTSSQKATE
ncbi:hypothetical protein DPMN_102000 [Dreissena polymorpha]|uniref:Uncharacterized protein n=1 Tax=Dreissena polymorpha TaxID=45954 RepID=A0A9D4LIG4_DREPO|nr:hypothetical protein DPMN_102000 [Dreissena polymorpha]